MSDLVRAIGRSLPATPLRDPAAFVAERRARQAQIAALGENLRRPDETARALDPNDGSRIDRAF